MNYDEFMAVKRFVVPVVSLVVLVVALVAFWWITYGRGIQIGKAGEAGIVFVASTEAFLQKPIAVTLNLNSQKNVNVVGVYLRFDPAYLQLTDMDTSASFCQLYPEKKYDNNLGTISLSCGAPHPGFKGQTTVMTLTFVPLQPGTTTIYTEERSQILASDGKGTNLLEAYPTTTITIFNQL